MTEWTAHPVQCPCLAKWESCRCPESPIAGGSSLSISASLLQRRVEKAGTALTCLSGSDCTRGHGPSFLAGTPDSDSPAPLLTAISSPPHSVTLATDWNGTCGAGKDVAATAAALAHFVRSMACFPLEQQSSSAAFRHFEAVCAQAEVQATGLSDLTCWATSPASSHGATKGSGCSIRGAGGACKSGGVQRLDTAVLVEEGARSGSSSKRGLYDGTVRGGRARNMWRYCDAQRPPG